MGYYRNNLSHGVRVGQTRIPPGQVRKVEGDDEEAISGIEGVESASEQDYKDQAGPQVEQGEGTPLSPVQRKVREARLAGRSAVAAQNQRVVGDDQAPMGPPTGTVTTKQAVRSGGDLAEKLAFGPGEAEEKVDVGEGGFSGRPPSQEIHNRQVENQEAVAEVAEELVAEQQEGGEQQREEAPAESAPPPKAKDQAQPKQ